MSLEANIRKKAGNFQLNVSFQTEKEIFAILGASGCGKSMTLKCIAGIETPDEGRIVINGRVVYDSEKRINVPPRKRKVGYMFQDYALFPNMTVEENIMAGMGKKPSREKVQMWIRRFHLEGLEKHFPSQLSGGQKQRTALARMMASEPEILLLDEPLSALDSYLKWQMEEELLTMLSDVGKSVLFVSHSRDEVYHLCDRICVIQNGHVEIIREKKEFFRDPGTVAGARISGCRNIAPAVRTGEDTLEVPGWGICFKTKRSIPEGLAYAGIRAHEIEVLEEMDHMEYGCARLRVVRLLEQQFESELILSCGPDESMQLRLLMDKKKAEYLAGLSYITICIPDSALLMLTE